MEIIETIPKYDAPDWLYIMLLVAFIIGIFSVIIGFCGGIDDILSPIGFLALGSLIIIILSIIFIVSGWFNEYKYDEYVVRLSDNYPAIEFNQKYEIVETYEYSDCIKVKKKEWLLKMSNDFPTRNIKVNRTAKPGSSGKIRKMDNFKTAMGMGANWIDQDTGIMYHIQEYYEKLHDPKIPADQKPTKIHMTNYKTGEDLGWAEEWLVAQKMKDPEPDPRY